MAAGTPLQWRWVTDAGKEAQRNPQPLGGNGVGGSGRDGSLRCCPHRARVSSLPRPLPEPDPSSAGPSARSRPPVSPLRPRLRPPQATSAAPAGPRPPGSPASPLPAVGDAADGPGTGWEASRATYPPRGWSRRPHEAQRGSAPPSARSGPPSAFSGLGQTPVASSRAGGPLPSRLLGRLSRSPAGYRSLSSGVSPPGPRAGERGRPRRTGPTA